MMQGIRSAMEPVIGQQAEETRRREMMAAMREAIQPFQTGNQQIVQAHRDMTGAINAQASAMGVQMSTHMAHFTQLMQTLGGQMAQNATNTGSLIQARGTTAWS